MTLHRHSNLTRRTRAESETMAAALRAEGLKLREIAERMGVAVSTVDAWINDPGGKRLACRKSSYRGSCEVCGAPTDGSNGVEKAPSRCSAHNPATARRRQEGDDRKERMIAMRRQGLSNIEIAEALGTAPYVVATLLSRARGKGFDVPLSVYEASGQRAANFVRAREIAAEQRTAAARERYALVNGLREQGATAAEIGKRFGITEAGGKSLMWRARKAQEFAA